MLQIKNLHVSVEGEPILKGFSLVVNPGEIHAIMGPNGAGKSTLAKVIAGHPSYEVTGGEILFRGKDILPLEPDERAHLGLFMGFQYPIEISGVSNFQFLHAAYNALRKAREEELLNEEEFKQFAKKKMDEMYIKEEFILRSINEGFSGGEKKRNEILQMSILNPTLAILDETDSGLDIDAIRIVSDGVNKYRNETNGIILITHYQRLLEYIKPDFVHVMIQGKIVETGGAELALTLEKEGYEAREKVFS